MESSSILSNYLMSSTEIKSDISFESFSREFPSRTPQDVVRAIYDQLIIQQEQNIRSKVIDTINNTYKFPVNQVSSVIQKNSSVKEKKLNNLINQMEKLASTLSLQEQSLSEESDQYIKEIKLLIGELSSLRYGRKDDFYEPAMDEARECIAKIKKFFDIKR
ncbi:uncharacterized protein SPAPADRAFT_52171 [Spathaspora passalidarum NRRL Y-27907]|uniref:Uncharacterized protein n=1 Tax=Spathaspora passalidarum (strain NRRL Y-27907 / 11-Y1) TaxID=619300 RepID=G3ATL9_SPAPN|nr:uncharacterized protein SPAPADRAFT_52171 [Spathaspora passalidarum NRRL Y-27907]EGW30982.1 hypothetical protein SPAPADRAFT_52171 [Spathaspora passalidarum NRRL Y-27907]